MATTDTKHDAQQALLNLERSKAHPLDLLDVAAQILGISALDDKSGVFLLDNLDLESHGPDFAPKEEWVLRWLLKKIKLANSDRSKPTTIANSPSFDTAPKTWVLFRHLVRNIPGKSLARVLHESSFLTDLDTSLNVILNENEIDLQHVVNRTRSEPHSTSDVMKSSRKRKRSPSRSADYQEVTDLSALEAPSLIIGAISRSVCVIGADKAIDKVSSQHMRIALSASPEIASALVGKLLIASSAIILQLTSASPLQLKAIITSISHLLKLWELRSEQDLEGSMEKSDQMFTKSCMKPALALLLVLKERLLQTPETAELIQHLERLIAVHSVHAARKVFFSDLSSQWKPDIDPIDMKQIRPVIDRLQRTFLISEGVEQASVAESNISPAVSTSLMPLLFDIAARSSPRNNVRRRQHEQPWLEALFITLIHICRPLPENSASVSSNSQDVEMSNTSVDLAPAEGLISLLDVAIAHGASFVLPILCYLTLYWIINDASTLRWTLLARVIEMDVNVFLPNSGMSTSRSLLEKLRELLSLSETQLGQEYDVVKNAVLVPLMNGFGHARDLSGFVDIWQHQLSNIADVRAGESKESSSPIDQTIWEDEDVFLAFLELAKTSATPKLVASLLSKTVQHLQDANSGGGDIFDTLALLAIIDTILASRTADCASEAIVTQALIEALCSALASASRYENQRWRLWRSLRHALLVFFETQIPADILHASDSVDSALVPLGTILSSNSKTVSNLEWSSDLKEAIECFGFLVQKVVWQPSTYAEQLGREIDSLTSMLDQIAQKTDSQVARDSAMWNGRVVTLKGSKEVAAACLGVLLQNAQALTAPNQNTENLWRALNRCAVATQSSPSPLPEAETSESFLGIFRAFLSTEQVTNNTILLHQLFDVVYREMEEGSWPNYVFEILLSMPLQDINKTRLARLSDLIVKHISSPEAANAPQSLELEVALLVRIVQMSNASIGLPQNWTQLEDLTATLRTKCDAQGSKASRNVQSALQKICDSIWSRAMSLPQSDRTKDILSNLFAWCSRTISEVKSFDYGVSRFAMVRALINGFWNSRSKLSYAIPITDIQQVRKAYFAILVSDLKSLCKNRTSHEEFAGDLVWLVRSLSICSDLCAKSKNLKKVLPALNDAFEDWKTQEMLASSMAGVRPPSSGVVEVARYRLWRLAHEQATTHTSAIELTNLLHNYSKSAISRKSTLSEATVWNEILKAKDLVTSLGSQNLVGLLDLLCDAENGDKSELARFFLIAATIEIARNTEPSVYPEITEKVPELIDLLCLSTNTTSLTGFCVGADCIRMVLNEYPGGVNQWTVDHLLGSVTIMVSAGAPTFDETEQSAAIVFERLCLIVGVVLGRFRKRLGGRYHLLVPVMQGLLRCLFAPEGHSSFKQPEFTATLAPWVLRSRTKLGRSAVVQYTRLLTSICDPTASSVKKANRGPGDELTDESKKARSIAGQYMQYVVMEYARCQLQGQIAAELKAALMPGLYAILDVMPRELMRAMNAAMDVSSRAIFKGLYDDYQRFGKWNQR